MRIEATELKDKLYDMLGKIMFGEEEQVIITKSGMPVAVLADYYSIPHKVKLGVADGKFKVPSFEEWQAMDKDVAEMFGV